MTETMTIVNTDFHIVKTELFDPNRMEAILRDTSTFSARDLGNLGRYKKNRKTGNQVQVVYHFGKGMEKYQLGRLFAHNNESLQSFPFDIRNPLIEKYYWDVDMVNAHYTILSVLADNWGLKTDAIRQYIDNRDEELTRVSSNRKIAKTSFLKVAYGGTIKLENDGIEPEGDLTLLRRIETEMKVIVDMCWIRYEQYQKLFKKKDNPKFSLFALILQTEERKCLLAIDDCFKDNGRQMDIYIHDGGEVRKLEGETEFPSELLRKAESILPYPLKLIVKPLTNSFVDSDTTDRYQTYKEEFEKTHFKLMNPVCYVRYENKEVVMLNKTELFMSYENLFYTGEEPFIPKWLADPNIRTYKKIVFSPMKEPPPECFNLFQGYPTDAIEGNISEVNEVLDLISDHNKDVFNYIEKLMAHIIQKPTQKSGVCLVVYSREQGSGKDTYFDLIGRILGRYFMNTSDAANQLFGRFNGSLQQCLLFKLEELSFADSKQYSDKFKGLITSNETVYENKGMKAITDNNYTNFVATTNNDVPVLLEDSNRRFCLIKASADRVGDFAFWNRIQPILHKPETASAYLYHLLNIDLTGFVPREYPTTEYAEEVKESFIPYHANFFQRKIQASIDELDNYEWTIQASNLLKEMNQSSPYEINKTKFGRDLKNIYSSCYTKEHTRIGAQYTISMKKVYELLIRRKWWYQDGI